MFKEYILLDTCDFLGKLLLALDVALAGDHDALGLGRARAMHGLGAVAYSTIVETDPKDGVTYDILYDILIKQTGDIHSDWDGTPLDVDAYGKAVFEPYDLKWLTRST